MKNIAKLSLVAAIAVSGFTSANAQSLEDAIKNVEVTGSVVYRYNDYNNDNAATNNSTSTNNYKVALGLASKVNDDVKFNSRFLVGGADSGFASLNTQTDGDSNVNVALSNAYFAYTGIKNTTVNVGKQGLTTPWTVAVDMNGNEQNGTGVLAMSNLGPVTLAGAFFNQTNLNTSGDVRIGNGTEAVSTVGAIYTVGPVTMDAWYLDADNILDTYTIGALAKLDVQNVKVGIDTRFVSVDMDNSDKNNTLGKITLTADAGILHGKLAYAKTDKEGGTTALDNDAVTTIQGWSVTANGKADANFYQASAGVDVLSNLNLSANYTDVDWSPSSTTDMEQEEIYAQLVYKMSKNLTSYIRYGTYTQETTTAGNTVKNNDDVRGRLQVAYTF
jgi:hypothetical protein